MADIRSLIWILGYFVLLGIMAFKISQLLLSQITGEIDTSTKKGMLFGYTRKILPLMIFISLILVTGLILKIIEFIGIIIDLF